MSCFRSCRSVRIDELIRRLRGDERGAIAIPATLSLFVVLWTVALSLDLGQAYLTRLRMQAALDAAAVAAAMSGSDNGEAIAEVANQHYIANGGNAALHSFSVTPTATPDGVKLEATGQLPTVIARVFGIAEITINVMSEASRASGDLEVALVLDNTGSMKDHMSDLRQGAKDLVKVVYDAVRDKSKASLSVVPYVGAVNIGNGARQMAWMDVNANSDYHGASFRWHWVAKDPGCTPYYPPCPDCSGGGGPGGGSGGNDRTGAIEETFRKFAQLWHFAFGIAPAHAQSRPPLPPTFQGSAYTYGGDADINGVPCFLINPPKVNHFDLFARIPNTSWKGCVEARPAPHDVLDTAPNAGDPNTLFVPYFWPDEPDPGTDVNPFPNNYLPDHAPPAGWEAWYPTEEGFRGRSLFKYRNVNGTIDSTPPMTLGPNQSCPDPIMPLTAMTERGSIDSYIDGLTHWEGSGTVSSEGLAWGWRVLSPGEPFTEGKPYGQADKYIIFMTDGLNAATEQASWSTYTDYTAYGYLQWTWRLPDVTYAAYTNHINSRMLEVCAYDDTAATKIYTIVFGNPDQSVQDLYRTCSSGPPYHYTATTVDQMKDSFVQIAKSITEVRITK